jgi:HPt (histidine-containing phosphotransfer) domain-containing protein
MSFIKKSEKETQLTNENKESKIEIQDRCTNLEYLNMRTKSNPIMMSEMITAYLNQTPQLINEMKHSYESKNWNQLSATIHKLIPSFSIIGMNVNFENMAKKVQAYAHTQTETENIDKMVSQLETVCLQACKELNEELLKFKIQNNDQI